MAWNHLATAEGDIDYAGLPLITALLGITDIEGLLHRLQVIKHHAPPQGK